jgi:eukaryotic-like serine/threonine-protein kinase
MNQTTETFLRIESIFHAALDLPAESRPGFLAERCAGDAEMRAEIEGLLEASEAEAEITASRRLEPGGGRDPEMEQRRIGPYEIDRLLGRGGMGAVYLAHRVDGQFEQQVAIKLIDLPLATDLFRERFRMERQILAGLNHPYIARLLDGGVSGDGELYLVMEYVQGTPIYRYCRERQLTVRQRLELFSKVCEAVQFAHQNLVVHRDLKPDNIFVAEDGTPRLLDFGTAKLTSPSQIIKPEGDLTRQGYQSFTPQYASPEQVLGNPITTASDTYSLGVLLYLILTESHPYELKELTTAEMMRVICQEPPRKPTVSPVSNRRLDADLEAILSKALRKEPLSRYLTAENMGADIRDYLAGRPVGARRGTFRYRAVKFARRNRIGIAAAVLIAATLFAGVLGVLWQARVANEERRKAEARSADLRQLSNSLLSELDEAIKQLPGSTGVQQLLVTRVLEHLDRMARDAQGDRNTQLDLIDAYTRLGNIQGNEYEQNIGDKKGGLNSLGKAIAIAQQLAVTYPKDPEVLRALAKAEGTRGEILGQTTDITNAVADLQAAAQIYERLLAQPGVKLTSALYFEACSAEETLGDVMGQDTGLADTAAALAAYKKCMDLDGRALLLDPSSMKARGGLANAQLKIGNAELDADPASALTDFRLALQRLDALPASEQVTLYNRRLHAIIVRKIGTALSELGQYSQAVPYFDQAIQTHQAFIDGDSKDARNIGDLKRALLYKSYNFEYATTPGLAADGGNHRQYLQETQTAVKQYLATVRRLLKIAPNDTALQAEEAAAEVRLGTVNYLLASRDAEAEAESRLGLAALRKAAQASTASPMVLELVMIAVLPEQPASLRDPEFALACAERGAALTHRKMPVWLLYLAQTEHTVGQVDKARATAREGLALLPPVAPGAPKSYLRRLFEIEAGSNPA